MKATKIIDVSRLSFKELNLYLTDDELCKFNVMLNYGTELPWIVKEIAYSLSDDMAGKVMLKDDQMIELFKLMLNLNDKLWPYFYMTESNKLNIVELMKHTEQPRYCIYAANGKRVATQSEVDEGIVKYSDGKLITFTNPENGSLVFESIENGVEELGDGQIVKLVNNPVMKLTDSELCFISMFSWSIIGFWRYYIKAGYKCEYDKSGNLKSSEVSYIYKVRNALNRMCELIDKGYCDSVIDKISKIKKAGNYVYASYASDEIKCDNKIYFIANQLKKTKFQVKSKNQFKCSMILKQNSKASKPKYSVEDKIALRIGYIELLHGTNNCENNSLESNKPASNEIKELCDTIRAGVSEHKLSSKHFSTKIVSTLSANNYNKCSDKQKAILIEAVNKINAFNDEQSRKETINLIMSESSVLNEGTSEDPSEFGSMGLSDLSDLLGGGLM